MSSLKEVLMKRDGLTSNEADQLIEEAKNDFNERLASGEQPYDICEEWFGLEPDYFFDLME